MRVLGLHPSPYDIVFSDLPTNQNSALFLGNSIIGIQVWQNKRDTVRVVLNRFDMWDERPIENFNLPEWKYSWFREQVINNNYDEVVKLFANPYDLPAPTQILGGALEFSTKELGSINSSRLYIFDGVVELQFSHGTTFQLFIHPTEPIAWWSFWDIMGQPAVILNVPDYHGKFISKRKKSSESNNNIPSDLNYPPGKLINNDSISSFHQPCWKDMFYDIYSVHNFSETYGLVSISTNYYRESYVSSKKHVENAMKRGYFNDFSTTAQSWSRFWNRSSIHIPVNLLLSQWYRDVYKIGCVSRISKPVITLQDIWTSDTGNLPPWKNDVHNDMNTQVTYWGLHVSNHIEGLLGFANWMENLKDEFLVNFTKRFFGVEDCYNIPGMTTLAGHPAGGWCAFAFNPTVVAWLSKVYYDYYEFSMDKKFMEEKLYPMLENSCNFFDRISVKKKDGLRYLPLSSSPEIHDDTVHSWFLDTITNFDLALVKFSYIRAIEIAEILGKKEDVSKWKLMLSEWPDYSYDTNNGFNLAPGNPVFCSHRHFSHLLAWHPLALIDVNDGESSQKIINGTLETLRKFGSSKFDGWSFVWYSNFLARALRGDEATESLSTFVKHWTFPNSFHNNGGSVFTLEANMGFISGLNEMLIQSHTGVIRLFPSIPLYWKDSSFKTLRARKAFLVSSEFRDGLIILTKVYSEMGENLKIENPYYPSSAKVEIISPHKILQFSSKLIEVETSIGMELFISKK